MATTLTLLVTLSLLFLAVGWAIAGLAGAGLAFGLAIVLNLVSYWYSDKFVLRLYHAQPFADAKLQKTLADLAQQAKLPTPKLYRVASPVPNAFATGRNPRTAVIAVTDGLLQLEPNEIKAVLGHELGHVKNRDILVASMAGVLAGAIGYLAQIGYWSMFSRSNEERSPMGLILVAVFAPVAALLIRMAISRQREYRADSTGAHLTKDPQSLADALKKIERASQPGALRGPASTSHLWISNPFGEDWFSHLFRTHPPIAKRVERLERIEV